MYVQTRFISNQTTYIVLFGKSEKQKHSDLKKKPSNVQSLLKSFNQNYIYLSFNAKVEIE